MNSRASPYIGGLVGAGHALLLPSLGRIPTFQAWVLKTMPFVKKNMSFAPKEAFQECCCVYIYILYIYIYSWLAVSTPLKNMSSSARMIIFNIYGKNHQISNVPVTTNQNQPDRSDRYVTITSVPHIPATGRQDMSPNSW